MSDNSYQFNIVKTIHICIGLAIMFFGPFFASPEFMFELTPRLKELALPMVENKAIIQLSPLGWTASIIFLGTVYLWIFVDTFWPSLVAMACIGLSPLVPLPQLLAQYLGNPSTFIFLFLFFFISALMRCQAVNYISNYLLTREILQGRPWLLLSTLFLIAFVGTFVSGAATLFMLWSVCYLILEDTGYKPGDNMSTFMLGNIVTAVVLCASTDIIKGAAFMMTRGYANFVSTNPNLGLAEINIVNYMILMLILAVCIYACILFTMRFILRIDMEPLRNFNTEKLKQNPLPPMNWKQKTILWLFAFYAVWMFLPAFLPSDWAVTTYLKSKMAYGSFLLVVVLCSVRYKGEPLAKVGELAQGLQWPLFFLIATVFYFSGIMTRPETSIPMLLEASFSAVLEGTGYIVFVLIALAFGFIVTNFMNSVAASIVLAPVIATISIAYGFEAMPIVVIFIMLVSMGMLTPAASLPATFLYGNKDWFPGKSAAIYATTISLIMFIVCFVVGLPLAQILF